MHIHSSHSHSSAQCNLLSSLQRRHEKCLTLQAWNASVDPPAIVPVGWKLHTGFHRCPHTLSYKPDSSVVREPDPQWLFPFPSPEEGKHAAAYVCFSIFSSLFLLFSKKSQPLAFVLFHSFLLSLSPVRMEADGSWHDGGIVLTVELMWPRGCCPCNTWPDGTECKALHRRKRVGREMNKENTALHGGRLRDATE